MSLCDTMWSSLKRLSTNGLKICTFWRAIWARRSRRISSSLLPLNMLPVMTSIQPCVRLPGRMASSTGVWRWTSGAALIFTGFRVDANEIAVVDERRHGDDESGFDPRRLGLGGGGRALDARGRVLDPEIDRRGQFDTDRGALVELHV